MNFRKLVAAELEILEAAEWYATQLAQLGDEFLDEVEAAFDRIRNDPELFARLENLAAPVDIRRCALHRFPYLVIYRFSPGDVLVVAVSHGRRKPFYWLDRLH